MSFRPQIHSDLKTAAARQDSYLYSTSTDSGLFCLNQVHVHEMFAQEPCLQLIGTEHFAYSKVVRAIIAEPNCTT